MAIDYYKGYTNIVQIHNNLVEAHYKFSKEQQLIMLQVAKTLQENDIYDKNEDTLVEYQADELMKLLNIGDRRTLRGVIKSLQRCIMSFENFDEQWEADVNVFSRGRYFAGGHIEIKIDELMLPFFKELNDKFTKLNMKELVSFKSQYSIRIYELARKLQFIKEPQKKEKIYTIDEFQKMVGSSFKTWQHIKDKVLEPAKAEINGNTRVYFDYEPIESYKKGQTRGRKGINEVKIIMNIVGHYQPSLL